MEQLLNYGTVECCGWWRPAICQCMPPVSSWRQLVRLLMFKRIRDQSIKMGQLVELFKQREVQSTGVYCDSITLVPLWSCQELLAVMKSLSVESAAAPDIQKGEYACKCSSGGYFEAGVIGSPARIKTLHLLLSFVLLLVLFFCYFYRHFTKNNIYIYFDFKRLALLNRGPIKKTNKNKTFIF